MIKSSDDEGEEALLGELIGKISKRLNQTTNQYYASVLETFSSIINGPQWDLQEREIRDGRPTVHACGGAKWESNSRPTSLIGQ